MINELILNITSLLQTNIIENHIISLDVWSIIHIISGLLIMLLLIKQKQKKPFIVLISILLIWEIFEFANYQILETTFFAKDRMINVVWDIIVGIGGGSLGEFMSNNK